MMGAWLAVAFLWGAAIALALTTWYFRSIFTNHDERIAILEAHDAESVIVVASTERDILSRIKAALQDEDDDDPIVKH